MKYQEHFLLDCDEVISYVKEKNLFLENANLTVKEIGDGNINYIFKVIKKSSEIENTEIEILDIYIV